LDGFSGVDFRKRDFGPELGKASGKEGFALLGMQGPLYQIARRSVGQAGRVDVNGDVLGKGGGEEGESLEVIPMRVGEKKGEGFSLGLDPVATRLAESGAGVDDQQIIFSPRHADAGGIASVDVSGNLRS
jgi:hypothetical protein